MIEDTVLMNDGLDSPPPSPSAIPLSSDVVLPSSACQLSLPPSPPFTPPPGLARMRATNSRPSPSPAWHAPSRPFSTATSLRPPLTLSLGAASQKTLATPAKKPQTFPSRPRISPRAALLQPGSARSNYFNLDFSFLDEAPPPGPSPTHHSYTPPSLRSSLNSSKWTSASDDSPDDSDSFDEDVSIPPFPSRFVPKKLTFPSPPRRSESNGLTTASEGTNRTSLPFESPRSSQYTLDASFEILDPQPVPSNSGDSSDSTQRSAIIFRSSQVFSTPPTPTLSTSSSSSFELQLHQSESEKQRRLAEFLAETAAAMEGGKSLSMVHPTTDSKSSDHPSTLAELAEAASPFIRQGRMSMMLPSATIQDRRKSSIGVSRIPGAFPITIDTRPGILAANRRSSVYYTPGDRLSSDSIFPPSESFFSDREKTIEEDDTDIHNAILEGPPDDLTLHIEDLATSSERSPTLHATSPVSDLAHPDYSGSHELLTISQEAQTPEVQMKMLERRRRTIEELLETEAIYASDMAVIRDIYIARARGADLESVADHVMRIGLGLGQSDFPVSSLPLHNFGNLPRRPSLRHTPSELRVTISDNVEPILAPKDISEIFSNLDEIAGFAENFSGLLDGAFAGGAEGGSNDRVGEVFLEQLPRIQQLYSTYCSRHHRAIVRLQELGPVLGPYLADCKTLSHGRTKAWDLASLLIKPVQRCLKYPLLLRQILAGTPIDHPNRAELELAHSTMLEVAEHINQAKKRSDLVGRIVNKGDAPRRDPNVSASAAFGRSMTKKLLRSSQKVKLTVGVGQQERDDMFDTLSALVDSTRSSVLRFSNEAQDWSRNTRVALESQAAMVEGWIELYAPMEGEGRTLGGGHERLCAFLDNVLGPVLDGPYQDLDNEVLRSLLVKTNHLLSLFENPRSVIAKRNDKLLDHARYRVKKNPADSRGSEEFLTLSAQLLEELPRFLGSVSRYFNIILAGFASAQATYHAAVQDLWKPFAEQWCSQIPDAGEHIDDEFVREHRPVSQIMETLALGLGVSTGSSDTPRSGRSTPTSFRRRPAGSPYSRTTGSPSRSPSTPGLSSRRISSLSIASTVASVTPSLLRAASEVSTNPSSHPSPLTHSGRRAGSSHHRKSTDAPLPPLPPPSPTGPPPSNSSSNATSLLRTVQEANRVVNRLSVYLEEEDFGALLPSGIPTAEIPRSEVIEEESNGEIPPVVLYVAEAMVATEAPEGMVRMEYPVLSFVIGDHLRVEVEEADSAEGGAGWLFGRTTKGEYGWGRSEDFGMVT